MTTKHLLTSSFKHVFADLAVVSSRGKDFSYQKRIELMRQIHAQL